MLNNFCFHVYAQKWVFVIMSHFACHMSHCLCQMSHCAFHMSCVKCLCWSLVHSEQLLFSCVSSKVIIYNYVTCHMSHVTCCMSYVKCLCWSLGHAEQFLFSCLCWNVAVYGWKCQWVFFDLTTLPCDNTNHRAGSLLSITRVVSNAKNAHKGCLKKNVTRSKFKSGITQEPKVLGGCPSHSL